MAVLTGAGCSTESGIPDYRGPETRRRARNPIQYKAFVGDPEARRRYWARAIVGWRKFAGKEPNPAHHALAQLETRGRLSGLITQNVDRLHQAAGSRTIIELHGALADVVCLECRLHLDRESVQAELHELNPGYVDAFRAAEMAPDGDADVLEEAIATFRVYDCPRCGGPLKPHVVFFGEGVPATRVQAAWDIIDEADALLVVGSSLAVFSGYRFVRGAPARNKPVAIVNLGETRGDKHAELKVDARAGELLPLLADAIDST